MAELKPGYGPPARLPLWARVLLGLALVAVVAGVLFGGEDREHLVLDEADPQFNLLYDDARLRRAPPAAGEVVRLQGRRNGVRAEVVVSGFELEPYRGDVSSGMLPILAEHLIAGKRAEPGFTVTDEGRARVNDAPGYQVGYAAAGDVNGRDVFVVEGPQARRGYLLSLRIEGRVRRARELVKQARKAFRSFRFGTGRA